MHIQKGRFRGKKLPVMSDIKGFSHATPSIVKEAVFQILDSLLKSDPVEYSFFDLCAGTGQMGFEAHSIGYGRVHLTELDQKRFKSLVEFVRLHNFDVKLHKKNFLKMVSVIETNSKSVIFMDLPYSFWQKDECPAIHEFLTKLGQSILNSDQNSKEKEWIVCIQGPQKYTGRGYLHSEYLFERYYGSSCVTFFKFSSSDPSVTENSNSDVESTLRIKL